MVDGLSELYQDFLLGSYDCVDRIVLNAYFRMGHSPGGFRSWWQTLYGGSGFEVFEHGGHGHRGIAEHPCAAESSRYAFNARTLGTNRDLDGSVAASRAG